MNVIFEKEMRLSGVVRILWSFFLIIQMSSYSMAVEGARI